MKYFYVICPVGADKSFTAKQAILQQVAREHGLAPFFPIEQRRRFSAEKAISDIGRSTFVLADLSLERPSCYFELGLAHAIHNRINLIAIAGTRVHQVTNKSGASVIYYSNLKEYRNLVSRIVTRFS